MISYQWSSKHARLVNWVWTCVYCRISHQEGDQVWLVSECSDRYVGPWTVVTERENCPTQQCRFCRIAPTAYPFHLRCLSTLEQYLYGHNLLEDHDWPLRCAEAMAPLPVLDARTSISLLNVLHSSFGKIMGIMSTVTPLPTLLEGLQAIPCELRELVFSFMLKSPGGCVLFNEDTLDVLGKLRTWPERRHRGILCQGALFARWDGVGQMACLAGLYDKNIQGCVPITLPDENWDDMVIYWNNMRIRNIDFVVSDPALTVGSGSGSVQILRRPAHNELWITLKGLTIARIQSSEEHHRRILWNSTDPLPLMDLSEANQLHTHASSDIAATYLALRNLSGISIAHCNGVIAFIHIHKKDNANSLLYNQPHQWVTWMYCPIGEEESILGIWLIGHSSTGTGLLIKTVYKTIWMCPYNQPSSPKDFELLAVTDTRAIYHCSCMHDFHSIPAHPATHYEIEPCRFPKLPSYLRGREEYQWSFSTASLSNVQAVRLSQNGGIELRYRGFSKCLGDFRPSEAQRWLENPVYYKISRMSDTRYTITFFRELDKQSEAEVLPLLGNSITVWSCRKESIIEVERE